MNQDKKREVLLHGDSFLDDIGDFGFTHVDEEELTPETNEEEYKESLVIMHRRITTFLDKLSAGNKDIIKWPAEQRHTSIRKFKSELDKLLP